MPDQFEKDRQDCIQAIKDSPEQNMLCEDCLTKKGYESEPESSTDPITRYLILIKETKPTNSKFSEGNLSKSG